jgi:hypothetical protein
MPTCGARLPHPGADPLRVERAAAVVDVAPVGVHAERDHVGAQLAQHRRPHPVGGTVGAVEHHAKAVERQVLGKRLLEEYDVTSGPIVDSSRLPDGVRRRSQLRERARGHQVLDLLLDGVGQLEAVSREELDPVVLVGVVTRRDHHAGVTAHVGRQEGHAGRGHGPHLEDVSAHRADAGRQGILEQVPGEPRVLADDDAGGIARVRAAEDVRHRLAQRERDLRRHGVDVGPSAHPVGPEEPFLAAHAPSVPGAPARPTCSSLVSAGATGSTRIRTFTGPSVSRQT